VKRLSPLWLVLFCLFVNASLFADAPVTAQQQASQYGLGDQVLSINAGLFAPLFTLAPSTGKITPLLFTQLSLGVVGSLNWAAYVTPRIRVGIDIAGDFSFSPNANALLMVPFIAEGTYVFSSYPFEIPVSFGLGMNIVKYVDQTTIDLLMRPATGLFWIYNSSWSFGLNLDYWLDMQLSTDQTKSRFGNFLEISLSALYHF
jgi:hypothetical protein